MEYTGGMGGGRVFGGGGGVCVCREDVVIIGVLAWLPHAVAVPEDDASKRVGSEQVGSIRREIHGWIDPRPFRMYRAPM